jgi:2-polyprenyl-3-methyl-5-hydroxy-6-metoxy-1,4-benzoquinol methylase
MDNNKMAVDVFDKRAEVYQEKYMDTSLYHDTFDIFCQSITKEQASILDIACGPGNITQYLLSKRPDFKILGIDLAPKMIELAKQNNPEANFKILDGRSIKELNTRYDGIICGFGLPYFTKEEAIQLINDAAEILKDCGVLYLSTMEDDGMNKSGYQTSSSGDKMYIHYHQEDYLLQAIEDNRLEIVTVQHKDIANADGTRSTDLIIIAKK